MNKDLDCALRFITCGSVDDGKSTLIGRLLMDSRSVLQDQLDAVSKSGQADLALFTDGLSAEREQGITIDVAWRYFATPQRKFIIGDAPGHVQYTRNMVTAASNAHAAVVIVDATKLDWKTSDIVDLLPQTRRHTLLVNLLRVPTIIFAVNKLDAVENSAQAFDRISRALEHFASEAKINVAATIPISALRGDNVVTGNPGWCGYFGPSLLHLLEKLPVANEEKELPLSFPVQWVEKFHHLSETKQGRRIFWGRVATGELHVGQSVSVLPGGQTAVIAQVLNHTRKPGSVHAGNSAGIVLDREVDISRGDWILASNDEPAHYEATRNIEATVAWMDDVALQPGRVYWALHGHRWVKAKVTGITHSLDVNTLQRHEATEIKPNEIGHVRIALQEEVAVLPYAKSRVLGSLILVDTASHRTSGALLMD